MVLNAFTPSRQVIKELNKGIIDMRLFCAATETQTVRLGQMYLHAHQFYAFGGHNDVNLHMQSWGMVIFI